MLKLENVSKYYYSGYNVVLALRKINLEFKVGEFVAVTGESGSGKSTLLNIMSGLDTYEDGKVYINNKDISHYSVEELENYRRDYIGFVFQDYNIIDSYTVYQNVEMALIVQGYKKEERHKKVVELIEKVGLTKLSKQKAIKLSGGEKQRMVIARTLAKDCQILVCDEPTGNLDTTSSEQVLNLLHEISKDKLVIIVTHDFDSMEKYVSRKVRLYDGEVIEDNIYSKEYNVSDTEVPSKSYYTRFIDMIDISRRNVFSVPKKSFFTMLVLIFLVLVTLFTYGNGIIELNKPYTDGTYYFTNTDSSRIIVTKYDQTMFTDDELSTISNIEFVRTVLPNDAVYDTVLMTSKYNTAYGSDEFFYYKIIPSAALDKLDLVRGTLPEKKNEVVAADNGIYEIGDYVSFSTAYRQAEYDGLETDQFVFKIVGLVEQKLTFNNPLNEIYLTNEGLEQIEPFSIFERSQVKIEITGTTLYHTPSATWITDGTNETKEDTYDLTSRLVIDNTLQDDVLLVYDMMFFDFCRDFGYKKEVRDDMDAGLCNVNDFIASHTFKLKAITTHQSDDEFADITLTAEAQENPLDNNTYMNQKTFDKYFGEEKYQVTAVVYDGFEAKQVIEELREQGFKAYYPSRVISEDDYLQVIVNNIRTMFLILMLVGMLYFVGYFVLRNIVMSKQKDYLIYRSLGTSNQVLYIMIYLEIVLLTIISSVVVVVFLTILEQFRTPIPSILNYFTWLDYLVIFVFIIGILGIMVRNLGRRIFNVSVISSLKGVER